MSAPIETKTPDQILVAIQELMDGKAAMRKKFTELLALAQKERDDAQDTVKYWKSYGDVVLRPELNARNREVSDLRERCEFIAKRCEGIAKERDDATRMLAETRDAFAGNRVGSELEIADLRKRSEFLSKECDQLQQRLTQAQRANAECDVFPSNRGSASDFEWLRQSNQSLSDHNKMLKIENDRLQKEWSWADAERIKLKIFLENRVAQVKKLYEERDAYAKSARRNADRLATWQAAHERKVQELESARRVNTDWQSSFDATVATLEKSRRMEEDWKRMYHVVCKERGELRAVLDTLEKHKGKL